MSYRLSAVGALLALTFSAWACNNAVAQTPPLYRVTKTVPIGAPDRWDYLTFDVASGRVFVAHGDRVTVVDGHDGTILGQVEGFPGGTHGVAIASQVARGYTDDGKAGTATSFDLASLKSIRTIRAAAGADAIVFDSFSQHVFVINGDSGSITVIDPASDAAVATIAVGGDLEFGTVDGKGNLYVNGAEKREIVRVDTTTNHVDARWPIANCDRPHGIAIDPAAHRLFVTCVNKLLVAVDTDGGAPVATMPIGARTDAAAFDAKRKLIFSSNGDGTLTVVAEKGPNQFEVIGNVPTPVGARTMALDPGTGRIYLVAADVTINDKASIEDARHRYVTKPGTAKLLFLDPAF